MMNASPSAAQTPAGQRKYNFFLLQKYYLRNSTQLPRINEFMSQGFLPAAEKLHAGPKIFLEAVVAAHMPQFVVAVGLNSLDEAGSLHTRLREDPNYAKAFAAWENGPEPPYEHYAQILLKTADYCPPVESPSNPGKGRIFELRTYHSPTWKQLAALHARFAGPEIRIFHRSGVHPILYSETVAGPNMPNLTYLTPFESLAAREKAWAAFGGDPEWAKVRKESTDAHGQISSVIDITLLKASAYSPIG